MSETITPWNATVVRTWLDRRLAAAAAEQGAADRRGYEARDDYDRAAAEHWVYATLEAARCVDDRSAFADHVKALLRQDDYPITGIHDDDRVERHVRATLRKVAKMIKVNHGFANTLRFQR